MALNDHYLGANHKNNMATQAESKLRDTTYNGEKRRWTFEKYVRIHVEQHAILTNLKPYGYSGIDEGSKVRYLMKGIRTNELDPVSTQIMANANLREDFDACVNLYQDFIAQKGSKNANDSRRVAALNSERRGGGKGKVDETKADMSIEDRYYKVDEYKKLSPAKKLGLKIKRDKRDGKGCKKGGGGDGNNHTVHLSKRSIAAIREATKRNKDSSTEATSDSDSDDSDDSDESIPMKPPATKKTKKGSNRHNAALQRKKDKQ